MLAGSMVEIEIGGLRGQCLDRRIDHRLVSEIAAWERQPNIKGMFTTARYVLSTRAPRIASFSPDSSPPALSPSVALIGNFRKLG